MSVKPICDSGFGKPSSLSPHALPSPSFGKRPPTFLLVCTRFPAVGEIGDDVFQAPEEVIGPVEALGRIALAAEEPGLPRHDARNARQLVELARIAHRIRGLRCACGEHQRDLVLEDQVVGDLACAVRVGLAVLQHDLHRVLLAADADAVLEGRLHLVDDPLVRFAEGRERPRLRRHVADLDRVGREDQRCGAARCQCGCGLGELSAIQCHGCLLLWFSFSSCTNRLRRQRGGSPSKARWSSARISSRCAGPKGLGFQ